MDRFFETKDNNGNSIKLKIKEPNHYINRMCDIEYKKAWAFSVTEGVKLHSRLEEVLAENDIWGPEQEKEIKKVEIEVAIFLKLMEEAVKENKPNEAKDAAINAALARKRLTDLFTVKQSAFTHSVEGIALEVKLEAYVAYATIYADDETKQYWKNYHDFITNRDKQAAEDAIVKYTQILINEQIETLKGLPENKYLIDSKIMSEDLKVTIPARVEEETKPVVAGTKKKRKKLAK